MLTARRSNESTNNAYSTSSKSAGVQVLESPETYEEKNSATTVMSDNAAAEMHKNLEKLLNYDRYSAEMQEEVVSESAMVVSDISEEDIRPTSTTMQFGEDIDVIREEMSKSKEEDEEHSYRLNNKGRVVLALYAVVVSVIMALIIINTGVLSNLSEETASRSAELNEAMNRHVEIQTEIEHMSSDEYIIDKAVNEMGMIKG